MERFVRQKFGITILGGLVPLFDNSIPQRHFSRVLGFNLMAFKVLLCTDATPELLNSDNFVVKVFLLAEFFDVAHDLVNLQLTLRSHLAYLDELGEATNLVNGGAFAHKGKLLLTVLPLAP